MTLHTEPHPLAGQTVKLAGHVTGLEPGALYRVEDYWDRVSGGSWMFANGNPACLHYAMRSGFAGIPTDDEVLYGKVDGLGHLVHVSEIEAPEAGQ